MERASRRAPDTSLLIDTVWRPPCMSGQTHDCPGRIAPLTWTIPGSLAPPTHPDLTLPSLSVFMEHVIRARPEAKLQGCGRGTSAGGCWSRSLLHDSFASAGGEAASYDLPACGRL